MPQPTYDWKTYPTSIKLGKQATKDLLYDWFLSLPLARRKRIVAELTRKV